MEELRWTRATGIDEHFPDSEDGDVLLVRWVGRPAFTALHSHAQAWALTGDDDDLMRPILGWADLMEEPLPSEQHPFEWVVIRVEPAYVTAVGAEPADGSIGNIPLVDVDAVDWENVKVVAVSPAG